jgi:hypothetical protein
MIDAPCTNRGQNYDIVSGADHLRLNPVRPLTMIVRSNIGASMLYYRSFEIAPTQPRIG